MHRLIKILLVTVLLGPAASTLAETLWVTDQLRLGLHRASDTSDRAFQTLLSGTKLEILERNAYYARVRLETGETGWVKAAYLAEEEPAAARVLPLTEQNEELQSEVLSLQAGIEERDQRLNRLEAELTRLEDQAGANLEELEGLRLVESELESMKSQQAFSIPGPIAWPALVLALGAGFLGGYRWLDSRIRKRHGGFRVW